MTTGKTIALTGQTFVSEVMALVNAVLFLRGEEGGGRSWPAVLGRVDAGLPWAKWRKDVSATGLEGPFPTPGDSLRWNLISVARKSSICLSNQLPWVVIVDQYL